MINVMIVEDDPMVREINEKFLNKLSGFYLLYSVGSIKEAKSLFGKEEIHLVLLDMFFPNEKGIELLKWIRYNSIDVDVMMITADRETESIQEAFRFGVTDYLVKPFKFERFKEALENYKVRHDAFVSSDTKTQEDIDTIAYTDKSLIDISKNEGAHKYIKGFNDKTFNNVISGIRAMEGRTFTSEALANEIGVSRITARRYLDFLESQGKLSLELEYGKVGRPKNLYRQVKKIQ